MSDWDMIGFAPQGWQCPICGAVYSPMTMQCFNCTGWKTSIKVSTSTDDDSKKVGEVNDGVHHYLSI